MPLIERSGIRPSYSISSSSIIQRGQCGAPSRPSTKYCARCQAASASFFFFSEWNGKGRREEGKKGKKGRRVRSAFSSSIALFDQVSWTLA